MGCCTGSEFTPAPDAALDPGQRVNFSFGMVLGVDDFRQEHAYLAGRDALALRETIGYGVLRGLQVSTPAPESASAGQQVRVAPGLALTPEGRLVGVCAEQCANLSRWLDAETLRDPATATRPVVYIVLRCAERSGTPVPIPGEPCRDESALQADARIADSFSIDFSWSPPDQAEDQALRSAAAWLRAIQVLDLAPEAVPLAQFQADVEAGLREAIAAWSAAPSPPLADPPHGAEPSSLGTPPVALRIPRAAYPVYLNAAFEVWVRLLRSGAMAHHGPVPEAEALAERGLLLAAVDVRPAGSPPLPPPAELPRVRMLGRPQLLHLRLLQEWLLRDGAQDAPREAHFLLGKADPRLGHAQDLHAGFAAHDHALARVDIEADSTVGGSGSKAVLRPAVKWPGGGPGAAEDAGGPDYYGPAMRQPIPVADGGTGQAGAPALGALLVGHPALGRRPAAFALGALVGAALARPEGPSANILVDVAGDAPNIRLDTVQDIGPGASPVFAGLAVAGAVAAGSLAVSGTAGIGGDTVIDGDAVIGGAAAVGGQLSVGGGLVLAAPLASVLAADAAGTVIAAPRWDGDAQALAQQPPPPYVYAPGQTAPVRIEDGGTGLSGRPFQMQILVGVERRLEQLPQELSQELPSPERVSRPPGDYVQATLTAGSNIGLTLAQGSSSRFAADDWQLTIDAQGGGTEVVAGGDPPSLSAQRQGEQTVIDTVQPLHPDARPLFDGLRLRHPSDAAPDAMLGWVKESGELVVTRAPDPVDVGRWAIRYVKDPHELQVGDRDHVLVSLVSGQLDLPDLGSGRISEGRVIVVKAGPGVDALSVSRHDQGSLTLKGGNALTLIAALGLKEPTWLVIGRS